eukprot:gene31618-53949_t
MAAANGLFVLQPNGTGGAVFGTAAPSRAGITRDYYWNNNAFRVIQPKSQRTNIFTSAEFDLTDKITAFADASLYRAESLTYREMDGITQSTDGFVIVPVTNPYNPFGVRFYHPTGAPNADGTPRLTGAPADVSLWTGISPGQNTGGGIKPRETEVYSHAWRVLGGVRGKVGEKWEWESALVASGAQTHEYEHFQVRESFLRRALARTDATAFNPFP